MNNNTIIHSYLYSAALQAALEAGKKALSFFGSEYSIKYKTDSSPVTDADMAAHQVIHDRLQPFGLPMLSEESTIFDYEERQHWQQFWLIDPLDGTKEFISGNGEFTVNIALIVEQTPVFGVVYAPVPDVMYFGFDNGSYKVEKASERSQAELSLEAILLTAVKLPCSNTSTFTVVASRSHLNKETADFIENLKLKHGKISKITKGSSLKLCAVAEGSANMYPRIGPTMEWDIAAGHAVLKFADGSVKATADSVDLKYNKPDLRNPDFVAVGME
jgi:3'(2'), 5'-bisphosphate nucleotidase